MFALGARLFKEKLSRPGQALLALSIVLLACTPPNSPPAPAPHTPPAPSAPSSSASPTSTAPVASASPVAGPSPAATRPVHLKAGLPPGPLSSIVWSRDGKAIATWCGASCRWGAEHKRRVVVWSLPRLAVAADISPNKDDMGDGQVHNVDFSPDGARLGTSTHNEVQVFDHDGWKLLTRIGLNAVYGAWKFSPDARYLAASDAYGHGVLVDAVTGAKKKDLQLHSGAASYSSSVAFSADGAWAAIEGNDLVRLAELRGGSIKLSSKVLDGRSDTAADMALSHDGQWFAIADSAGRIELWSAAGPSLRKVLDPGGGNHDIAAGCRVAFSPRKDQLAALHRDGSVRVWEAAGKSGDLAVQELRPKHAGALNPPDATLAWSADGRYLAWATDPDHSFGLWDAQGGAGASVLGKDARKGQATLRWSPVGHRLARGDGQAVELWDIDARRVEHRMTAAVTDGTGLAFSPDAAVLGAADGDVHFLRAADGAALTLRSSGIAKSRRSLRVGSSGGFDGDPERIREDLEVEGGAKLGSEDLAASDAELAARFFAGK